MTPFRARSTGAHRAEVDSSLAKQGVILNVLSAAFGPYPFRTIGGIDPIRDQELFFALGPRPVPCTRRISGSTRPPR